MPKPFPIGPWLRAQRKAAALSRDVLAVRAGTTSKTLGSYERGDTEPPLSVLQAILAALGKKLGDVPGDNEKRVPRAGQR